MEVHKVEGSHAEERKSRSITEENLRSEFAFLVAGRLAGALLERGLITPVQNKVLMDENARSFPGALSSLYLLKTCYINR